MILWRPRTLYLLHEILEVPSLNFKWFKHKNVLHLGLSINNLKKNFFFRLKILNTLFLSLIGA